ncbi:MAG TPA: restriction endonuclease [Rhizomicrobium sp.]
MSEYFVAAMECIKKRGGSTTIEEMEEDVADKLRLSDAVRAIPHGDGRRSQFQYDLAWVRTYLKWGNALENSERGIWHITKKGRELSEAELRGLWARIVTEQREQRKQRAQKISGKEDDRSRQEQPPQEIDWKEKLLDVVLSLDSKAFERLCQRVLRESGFIKVEVTGRTNDGGIDGVGVLRVNLLSFHVLFQCKKWKSSVGAPVIRDFRGAMMGRADKGLVLTTGTFTADARKEATRDGAPAIDLIDGDSLCDLLKLTKIGVSVAFIEQIKIDEAALKSI